MKKVIAVFYGTIFVCLPSVAGVMRHDTNIQDYRDFAENLGKYRIGESNIAVYKKSGELNGYLNFPMPDLSSVSRRGFASLTAPSYVMSARHVGDLGSVFFGGASEFSPRYSFISRNAVPNAIDQDFMLPRLNKVATEAAPVDRVENSELKNGHKSRYTAYARVGSGTMVQIDDDKIGVKPVGGAYKWLAGGSINPNSVEFTKNYYYWTMYDPDHPYASPLSISSRPGDSGSPYYVYDSVDEQWKIAAVHSGGTGSSVKYGMEVSAALIPDNYFDSIVAANTSPDVMDNAILEPVYWNAASIDQADQRWSWQGLAEKYRHLAPKNASYDELDASKDIRFNGMGGDIILNEAVNLGAGKLQFSNNYSVKSADGVGATWVGGGIEVEAGKRVLWQVNGLADDDLHKIGGGTLHVNATGKNEGGLNVGDGTVILDQQADEQGNQQAFSQVMIVSGRPTVVLNNANQVAGDNIFFGYRGGVLDLNGTALQMKRINHTDDGAVLINKNADDLASLTLSGFTSKDISFNTWTGARVGKVGDIYMYQNSRLGGMDYFQLKTENYGYFPTNRTDDAHWKFIGNDAEEAKIFRVNQFNQLVFRGFIGTSDAESVNGKFDITFSPEMNNAVLALAGGSHLNGNINVDSGTLLLSGQPVPHAGGVVVEDDWYTSTFVADNIVAANNTRLQIGEYAQVKANIQAGDNSQILLGYNPDAADHQQVLRCIAPVQSSTGQCSTAQRNTAQLHALPASIVNGDITLGDKAELYLGKVNYRGNINDRNAAKVMLSSETFWNLSGDSRIHHLSAKQGGMISTLSAQDEQWRPKQLWVENMYANDLQLGLGIAPQTGISDSLYIDKSAQGSGNTLDLGFMLGESIPNLITKDIVLLDAPFGTAHNFFTLPSIQRGFSIYTPDYQVIEKDGRVKWIIAKTPEPIIDPLPEPEIKPDPVIDPVPEPEIKPEPPIDPVPEPEIKPEPVTDPTPEPGKPEDWFNISDNDALLHSTRALLASRQYLFNETVNMLNDRARILRDQREMQGVWGNYHFNRGGIEGVSVKQQTFELGVDKQAGDWRYGLVGSQGQGSAKGPGTISHQLSTVGTYATWMADNGGFIDLAARYLHLRQDLHLDPALDIKGSQRSSHMLAASTKLGHEFRFFDSALSLSPYLEASIGYLPAYHLQGYDARVKLSAATPWSLSPGIELKQRGLGPWLPGVSLSATFSKLYSPASGGSTLTLQDSYATRRYDAWSDNRYRMHLGLEGKLSEKWSLNLGAKRSVGGKYFTDTSLESALSYSF
jgi:serine protease autotransporter